MQITSKQVLIISISIFVLSLIPDAYCYNDCSSSSNGLFLFLFGWIGSFFGGAGLCWLANPLIIFSWILYKTEKESIILSGIASVIAGSFLIFDKIIIDEAGHYGEINEYLIAYQLWLLSIVVFFIGNLIVKIQFNKKQK